MKINAIEKFQNIEEYEKNCYVFSPSISKRRNVGRQTYYVRRYFRGDKDFERTMKTLATKQSYKNER